MPTHKSSDYKLSAVKYYLSHSKNQLQTCKIFGCSERSLMRWVEQIPIHIYKNIIKGAYDRSEKYVKRPSTRKRKPKKYLD